jgi:tricorn protease-like protein/C-terminal processing protease CtpA/Prc
MPHPVVRLGRLSAAAVLAVTAGTLADVTPHAGMLRYPDVSKELIAFTYAGDIWLVPRAGGSATRLTTAPGQELFPKFSPDGKTVAFVGNYDGNRDIYTIPVEGGTVTRVTHHPGAETICDWTSDGKSILFYTSGLGGLRRQTQLFTIGATGGPFEELPVPYGANGAISPSGEWLAYTPHTTDFRTWKRYRGGMATDIWLFNLKDKTSKQMTTWEGTDTLPMWQGDTVYYLSDETTTEDEPHRLNIWQYSMGSGKHKQVTHFKDFDIKWPSIGPGSKGKGEIVFQNGSSLYLLDLGSSDAKPTTVTVTIPGDRPRIRTHQVNAADYIGAWTISPSAKRVAVEARGDVWTLPAEKGSPRNLTRTSGCAERDPSWSPDGKWIAYFCDETGEYELYLAQSDGEGEKHQITKGGNGGPPDVFRFNPTWSPDSKRITFTDKAGGLYITTLGELDDKGEFAKAETKPVDTDPWSNQMRVNWSNDGKWLTYSRSDEDSRQNVIWLYNVDKGEKHRVTSGFFDDTTPTFDRKGDWLFFTSKRTFNPTYSELDTTFIYHGAENILAIPLRKDLDSPWAPKSDEEDWKTAKKDEDKKDEAGKGGGDKDEKKEGDKPKEPAKDDGVSGTWEGTATGPDPIPPGGMPFTLKLKLGKDNQVSGTLTCPIYSGSIGGGTWDPDTKALKFTIAVGEGENAEFELTLKNDEFSGKVVAGGNTYALTGNRAAAGGAGNKEDAKAEAKSAGEKKAKKKVVIDLEGMEARAIMLPINAGRFGNLAVNDKNQLLFTRLAIGGSDEPGEGGVKLFDLTDEKKEEKAVAAGVNNFELTADGKKLLAIKGKSASIQEAAAGGTGKNVPTAGMTAMIDPRAEWKQIFTDAWRIERDYFYDPNMHGVDWKAMRERYGKMLEDASSRDDVSFIISEMISELNVGHAYYNGGDIEQGPSVSVGMLGCDFELVPAKGDAPAAYRISRIYKGAEWDADAKGPLTQPGVNVKEGDYLLAVNGVPVDPTQDPWTSFQGLGGRVITITVNDTPSLDRAAAEKEAKEKDEAKKSEKKAKEPDTDDESDKADSKKGGKGDAAKADDADAKDEGKDKEKAKKKMTGLRDVVVQCLSSEDDLRYRAWIEAKRKYVEEKSGGKVGYIYVPDTGQNGQNNLFRQFYGQAGKQALIIDERWNGGGQIPTRFIELLNRPATNYWARRDGKDWTWPPDSHQGPKCMLINGLAGSGGDAFPSYFHQMKLGKLIGMRTWGGLVGISGNPGLIDGGSVTAPTFGFYKLNGTWGIEGHGVDPDIQVVDDPAKMQRDDKNFYGGDPQLDRAIELMLTEVKEHPYTPPKKPQYPNRSGMGVREEDR